jgi:hypothetical protein
MMDLFTSKESRVDFCMYEGSKLGVMAKESMLHMVNYEEYNLSSKMSASLTREIAPNLVGVFSKPRHRFSPSNWVQQPQLLHDILSKL